MHISLQSKLCLGTCAAIEIYNAYQNPVRWITFFAMGILVGTCAERVELNGILNEHPNDDQKRGRQITSILTRDFFLYFAMASVSNLITLGVMTKAIQLPSLITPRFLSICAALDTGFTVGYTGTLLGALRQNKDPWVQNLLAETTI